MTSKKVITDFQRVLKEKGFYKGQLDGDFGPLTAVASQQFFKPGDQRVPPWIVWATQELGVHELAGPKKNNPRILHYHSFTTLGASTDEVAWCSSFINAGLLEGAGIRGTNNATAASFKSYGNTTPWDTFGAIQLKATETGSRRHVFFNIGYFKDYVFSIGGNQSDMVNVQVNHKSLITESRYPKV